MVTIFGPNCLEENPEEASLVGRLLIKYGEIEWALCRVVEKLSKDFDGTVKAMYRTRGELARLQIADALAGSHLTDDRFGRAFRNTWKAVDQCRSIRNKYAHAHWFSIFDQGIGFYDLEGIAKTSGRLDMATMKKSFIDRDILTDQVRFFGEVQNNLQEMFSHLESSAYTRGSPGGFSEAIAPPTPIR